MLILQTSHSPFSLFRKSKAEKWNFTTSVIITHWKPSRLTVEEWRPTGRLHPRVTDLCSFNLSEFHTECVTKQFVRGLKLNILSCCLEYEQLWELDTQIPITLVKTLTLTWGWTYHFKRRQQTFLIQRPSRGTAEAIMMLFFQVWSLNTNVIQHIVQHKDSAAIHVTLLTVKVGHSHCEFLWRSHRKNVSFNVLHTVKAPDVRHQSHISVFSRSLVAH